MPWFHLPLIEPGVRIGRTRLSDKDSCLRRRARRGRALEPQQAGRRVQVAVRVACPLRPPQVEFPRLPEKYRLVIVLCDLEGRSRAEVAKQLRSRAGTVGSRLARGRELLAQRLARRGLGVPATLVAALASQQTASGAVPAVLLTNTIKAVSMLAAGETVAAGLLSTKVPALAESAAHAVAAAQHKTAGLVLIVATFVLTGGAFAYHTLEARRANGGALPSKSNPTIAVEPFGSEEGAIEFAKHTILHPRWIPVGGFLHLRPGMLARLDRKNGQWTVTGTLWEFPYGDTVAHDWMVIAKYGPGRSTGWAARFDWKDGPSDRSWKLVGGNLRYDNRGRRVREGVRIHGTFARPAPSAGPVSSLNFVGGKGETVTGGQTFAYGAKSFTVETSQGVVIIHVAPKPEFPHFDTWTLKFGGPGNRLLAVGEYDCAKAFDWRLYDGVLNRWREIPGIVIARGPANGQGGNGKFVVWEFDVKNEKVPRLAIDFIQCGTEGSPPLCGSLRFNSHFQPAVPVPGPPPWE